MKHGATPDGVWRLADGGHIGPASAHYAKLKAAFEAEPAAADQNIEAIRQAGIRGAEKGRQDALRGEQRERVTGRFG